MSGSTALFRLFVYVILFGLIFAAMFNGWPWIAGFFCCTVVGLRWEKA